MKTQTIPFTVAAAIALLSSPAIAKDGEGGTMVSHSVTASSVDGATLWDYNGEKIGKIEHILLLPGTEMAMAVVKTTMLDEVRKIVVPWRSIQVQTKEGNAEAIIYALDADKAKLTAAPSFTGEKNVFGTEVKSSYDFWLMKEEPQRFQDRAKKSAKKAASKAEGVAEEVEGTVKGVIEGVKEGVRGE